VVCIEFGWAPRNWMALTIAAFTSYVVSRHLTSHGSAQPESPCSLKRLPSTLIYARGQLLRAFNNLRRRTPS